jgi:AcrR family transcriptional regulator
MDLVLERGLHEVTVEEIAEAAGVSPRTFFNYFPTKKAAVIPGAEPISAEAVAAFVADRDTPLWDGLQTLLTGQVAAWSEMRRDLGRTQQLLAAHPELMAVLHERIDEFESTLVAAVAARLRTPPGDDRPVIAATVCGALVKFAMTCHDEESAEHIHRNLVRAFAALRSLREI